MRVEDLIVVLVHRPRKAGGRPCRTAVCAVNDLSALAALQAFREAGQEAKCAVIGQDGIPEARAELRRPDSRLAGTVAYFPERYGERLVRLALDILSGRTVPPAVFTSHQLLTSANVDTVYPHDGWLPALGGVRWPDASRSPAAYEPPPAASTPPGPAC